MHKYSTYNFFTPPNLATKTPHWSATKMECSDWLTCRQLAPTARLRIFALTGGEHCKDQILLSCKKKIMQYTNPTQIHTEILLSGKNTGTTDTPNLTIAWSFKTWPSWTLSATCWMALSKQSSVSAAILL